MHLLALQILSISTSLLAWIIISSCCCLQWQHYKRKLSSTTPLLLILFATWITSTYALYESFFLCESNSLMSSINCWSFALHILLIDLYCHSQAIGSLHKRKEWLRQLLLPGILAFLYITMSSITSLTEKQIITSYVLDILNNLVTASLGGCIIWKKYFNLIIKREFRLSFPRIAAIPINSPTPTTKKVFRPNEKQQEEIYNWLYKPEISNSKVTLKLIAKDILIAPSALSAFIKQELGVKFSDYITSRRLDNAEKALIDKKKNKTIIEIAEETGFQSTSAFYRDFAKRHQVSPLKWREQVLAKMNQKPSQ